MIAWVMKDYLGGFRWGRIKEVYKIGGWWMPIYFLIFIPMMVGMYEDRREAFSYTLVFLPIVFCILNAPLHAPTLPKLMYLCPVRVEDRRKYLVLSAVLRVGVPIFVGILAVGGLLLLGFCDWIMGLGVLMNISFLALLLGLGGNQNGYGTVSGERSH